MNEARTIASIPIAMGASVIDADPAGRVVGARGAPNVAGPDDLFLLVETAGSEDRSARLRVFVIEDGESFSDFMVRYVATVIGSTGNVRHVFAYLEVGEVFS